MLKIIAERIRQGYRTAAYPDQPPVLPDRFRGRPDVDPACCADACRSCVDGCPAKAIHRRDSGPEIDLGKCLFCGECARICPRNAIRFTAEYRLATRQRADLAVGHGGDYPLAAPLRAELRRLFGRSLRLRQVSAGGCNACEADSNVLGTPAFDISRFGIQFVASPRHADGLLVTGPVTENMRAALLKTYEAIAEPRLVIACGACAISGGLYADHPETHNGAGSVIPVDLYIPGCPPHPYTILDGLLRFLGRLPQVETP